MKTLAIVQARMGSSRFPKKVLAPLAGKPMLGHVLDRLLRCRLLDRVVVAFTSQGALAALAPTGYESVAHDLLFVLALLFVTLGFAKFLHALRG